MKIGKLVYTNLPDTIAIVGSRSFNLMGQLRLKNHFRTIMSKTKPDTVFVSGGARGVDSWAAESARKESRKMVEYLPDKNGKYPAALFERNLKIIKHVKENDGMVLAFINVDSWRGTSHAVLHALKQEVPVNLYMFDEEGKYLGEVDNVEEYVVNYRKR